MTRSQWFPRLLLLCFLFSASSCSEPICSKFHYEQQMMEKVIRMEYKMETLMEQLSNLRKEKTDLKDSFSALMEMTANQSAEIGTVFKVVKEHEVRILSMFEDLKNLQNSTHHEAITDVRIAFTAYLDQHVTVLKVGQSIPFNLILTDIGQNYNLMDKYFLAPRNGSYFFTWHTQTSAGNSLTTCLAVNGTCQVHAYANARSDQHGDIQNDSNSAILNLNTGDRVWIEVQRGTSIYSNSGSKWYYPTFSGYKLF